MATASLISIEAFEALPDEVTARHELVEGEMVEVSSSTPENSLTRIRIISDLTQWLKGRKLGLVLTEVDVRTAAATVRRPDAAVFSAEQAGRIAARKVPVEESPMIAIEVLSHSESVIDVHRKVVEYLGSGSLEVWLIDPENRHIQIFAENETQMLTRDQILTSKLLPGFESPLPALFGWHVL